VTDPTVRAGRREIAISHADKVLFPEDGITKLQLAEHYARVAPVMIPHTRDRPLTLHVFPGGLEREGIFIKKVPFHFPAWIDRVELDKREGGRTTMAMANEPATLVFLANQNCITPHVFPARADDLEQPDRLIFDFDPPDGTDFAVVRRTALACGDLLREAGLAPFAMTTGSRGVHVVAPLRRDAGWDVARALAHRLGERLAEGDPDHLTMEHRIANRGGRIYVDTTRNAYAQHTVAPYAVRPKAGAPVATPLEWDELSDSSLTAQSWTLLTLPSRLDAVGDPWKGMGRNARSLVKAAAKAGV
jgi:bifunctional non-homologous end joining protein LigD